MIFQGINLYTGEYTRVNTQGGQVLEVVAVPPPADTGLPYLSRGFVDIQVNGYRGVDYSGENLDAQGILALVRDLARAGTLRHQPTLITGSFERTRDNLIIIREALSAHPVLAAAIAGVHLEGPYISGEDGARGAHDIRYARDPDIEELRRWQDAAGGLIAQITLAPERRGAIPFIEQAVEMGIRVSIGHTMATPEEIAHAADAGATLSTHLGNGSPAMLPRLHNPIWAQLALDKLRASIIADGYHLPPAVIKVFARAKGAERLVLTSDVGPMGGLAPGRYAWGSAQVQVHPDGHLGLADTPYLAGAGHLLDRCVRVYQKATACTFLDAVDLATARPLDFLGLPGPAGDFVVGETADIISFDAGDERLQVRAYALGSFEERIKA